MSATLEKNVAIIDGVTSCEAFKVDDEYGIFKAIEPETIPPFTINDIKIWVKLVNVGARVIVAEALARRWLMIAGWSLVIERDEDEVFELTIPVMNLTNENVNISVGDEIAVINFSSIDNWLTLSQAEWDAYDGYGVHETVTITVTDGTDPIEGASVKIDWGTAVTTDSSGEAEFSNISATTHTVTATATGYNNFSDTVDFSEEDEAEIEMEEADEEDDD